MPVGVFPQGLVFTRGKVFVLNGNLDETFSPGRPELDHGGGPGHQRARQRHRLDPAHRRRATPAFADVGSDGLLYVMNTGDYFSGEGRLSVVDPLSRTEVASFAGLGTGPGNVAADPDGRIFVSSFAEGVMEFNLDSNKVVRGAGQGITFPSGNSDGRRRQQGPHLRDRIGPLLGRAGRASRTCSTQTLEPRPGRSRWASARPARPSCRFRPSEPRRGRRYL